MTSMEVKHMPPLEMGKATCRWIIRASGHSKKPRPKRFFKNSHQGGVKNNELIPKTLGGGGGAKRGSMVGLFFF